MLSVEDEAAVVAFRRHNLLPLDNCLYALQATIPHLTRSSLHRRLLLVAIDRVTKFAFVQLHEKATRQVAGDVLRALIKAVPYTIHSVLTGNGTHFTSPGNACSAAADIRRAVDHGEQLLAHAFEYACAHSHINPG